jgi:hypothetical protein
MFECFGDLVPELKGREESGQLLSAGPAGRI